MAEKQKELLGITPQGWVQVAVITAAVALAFVIITWSGYGAQGSGAVEYLGQTASAEFASCLTEKGAVFYGTNSCPHCKDQKAMFGDSFSEVTFIDCEASRQLCRLAGVTAYPTWIINGEKYTGTRSLETLGALAGCGVGA
jgi:glutaredoxin